MSNLTRLLFNLGVSYTLMNREEFTDKFTSLFEKYQWDEEKLAGLSNAIMDELDQFRMRKNMAHVVNDAQKDSNQDMLEQIQKLSKEVEKLNQQLRNNSNPET